MIVDALTPGHESIHTEAEWSIYVSVKWVTIGSDNSLLPVWHQAII